MAIFPTRLLGLMATPLAALAMVGGCDDGPEGAPRVVVVGPAPKLANPAAGPLSAPDAALLQAVAQGLVAFDANGNIVAGLAERWNVSNDGLSYIFRIAPAAWADGRKVDAEQVARALRRAIGGSSRNPLRDPLGAVSEVVAMTDRVLEIRLSAPRPHLLSLLAQPEMAILRGDRGTGPFAIDGRLPDGALRLNRKIEDLETEEVREEEVLLSGLAADEAVAAFIGGKADLILGGTFADLPLARQVKRPRDALRFDPASGLFGLAPGRGGRFASEEWRGLLNRAIDRDSFVAALGVPGLTARSTLFEAGLDGVAAPAPPGWAAISVPERRIGLRNEARGLLGERNEPAEIRLWLPRGSGGDLLLRALELDWSYLGLKPVRAASIGAADYVLIDEVAPSSSPAWFARRFRCEVAPLCDPAIDELLQAARTSPVPDQRYALLSQAAAKIDEQALFLPIGAPVRWALVSDRIKSFSGSRFARHSLIGLDLKPTAAER